MIRTSAVRVSAPGKAILMGEHAAVYGRPALVAALDRRVHVQLETSDGPTSPGEGCVDLDLPALGIRRRDRWNDLVAHGSRVREAWRHMNDGIDASGVELAALAEEEDRSQLARIALAEALGALDASAREDLAGTNLSMKIGSEFPVGSGFGSSAAIAVAVIRGVFELAGCTLDDERLQAVSLEVERRQHGSPSGVDNATVIHGGVLWVERTRKRRASLLHITPLDADSGHPVLNRLRIFQTGEPTESTGEVVSAVRTLRARDEDAFDGRLQTMEDAATTFRQVLEEAAEGDSDLFEAIDAMRRFESCLEALGVVPAEVQECIRRVEEAGGAAKISGAGSLTGPGAGSLLVLHPRPEVLAALDALGDYEPLEMQLGGDGLRVETPSG